MPDIIHSPTFQNKGLKVGQRLTVQMIYESADCPDAPFLTYGLVEVIKDDGKLAVMLVDKNNAVGGYGE